MGIFERMLMLVLLLGGGVAIDDCTCACDVVAAEDPPAVVVEAEEEVAEEADPPPPVEEQAYRPAKTPKQAPLPPADDPRMIDPQLVITGCTACAAVSCVGFMGVSAGVFIFAAVPALILMVPVVGASAAAAVSDVVVHQGDPGWRTVWTALAAGGAFVGVSFAVGGPLYGIGVATKNEGLTTSGPYVGVSAGVVAAGLTTLAFIVMDPELNGR